MASDIKSTKKITINLLEPCNEILAERYATIINNLNNRLLSANLSQHAYDDIRLIAYIRADQHHLDRIIDLGIIETSVALMKGVEVNEEDS